MLNSWDPKLCLPVQILTFEEYVNSHCVFVSILFSHSYRERTPLRDKELPDSDHSPLANSTGKTSALPLILTNKGWVGSLDFHS